LKPSSLADDGNRLEDLEDLFELQGARNQNRYRWTLFALALPADVIVFKMITGNARARKWKIDNICNICLHKDMGGRAPALCRQTSVL
jgi:hypothetical protein